MFLGTLERTKWILMTLIKYLLTSSASFRITARITIIVLAVVMGFLTMTTRASLLVNELFDTTISNNNNHRFIGVCDITIFLDGMITHAFFGMLG
jgi:hypothetical protein